MYSIIITKILSKTKSEVVFESTTDECTFKAVDKMMKRYMTIRDDFKPYKLSFQKHNIWNELGPYEYLVYETIGWKDTRATAFHVNFKEIIED